MQFLKLNQLIKMPTNISSREKAPAPRAIFFSTNRLFGKPAPPPMAPMAAPRRLRSALAVFRQKS
jgi:hypothetical protein